MISDQVKNDIVEFSVPDVNNTRQLSSSHEITPRIAVVRHVLSWPQGRGNFATKDLVGNHLCGPKTVWNDFPSSHEVTIEACEESR